MKLKPTKAGTRFHRRVDPRVRFLIWDRVEPKEPPNSVDRVCMPVGTQWHDILTIPLGTFQRERSDWTSNWEHSYIANLCPIAGIWLCSIAGVALTQSRSKQTTTKGRFINKCFKPVWNNSITFKYVVNFVRIIKSIMFRYVTHAPRNFLKSSLP